MVIDAGEERRDAGRLLGDWRIKAAGIDALPDSLSGGNQQKVVVAKWMATKPRVLLLDEPTKGVDVGAKFEIHEMIRQQAAAGLAVLVVSSDLPEILALADRILVMNEGELQGELAGAAATEEAVMHLATRRLRRQSIVQATAREATARGPRAEHRRDPDRGGAVLRVVSLAGSRARASVPQRRERAADPEVLVDLRHRRGRRRGGDHLRRHRSRAGRGDRAVGRRHRPPLRRRRLAARRRASPPACWSASRQGCSRRC